MRSAAAAEGPTDFTPVFDWSPPRHRKGLLAGFIVASAGVHALCFYVFQIIYPPTVGLLPPPARINIITPESEDGRVLLRWIEAEDPALSSTTLRPPNAAALQLPKTAHVPSFAGREPELRELPPYQPDRTLPTARPPRPVPIARPSASPQPVSVQTRLTFSETEALGSPELPQIKFTAARPEPPEPAQFRVAIGSTGEVRHCFLETSSGDPELDEQARAYLLRLRFPALRMANSELRNPLAWTIATFEWGNDFAAPAQGPNEKAKR